MVSRIRVLIRVKRNRENTLEICMIKLVDIDVLQMLHSVGDNWLAIMILSLVLAPWGAMALIAYALSLLKNKERK